MKRLIGFAMVMASGTAGAETLKCKAQVPSTGCGSGIISVMIDLDAKTYESVVGAVACWGSDHHSKGTVIAAGSTPFPHTGSTTYVLTEKEGTQPFARLILQDLLDPNPPASLPAFFDVSTAYVSLSGRLIRKQFNVECVKGLVPPEPSSDDYHCSIGYCGGW